MAGLTMLDVFDRMMCLISCQWNVDHFDRFSYTYGGRKKGFGEPCSFDFARKVIEMDPDGALRFEIGGDGDSNAFRGSCPACTRSDLKPVVLAFPSCYHGHVAAAHYIEEAFDAWDPVFGHADDMSYGLWQVCSDPRSYPTRYGTIDGFPILKQRLEPPFGIIERIDVTKNPGKSRMVNGFYRHVASEMWLGSEFWEHASCSKEDVLAADWILEKKETSQFLYIKTWHELFTRPDGEQGRQQARLWRLLFDEDCEWPPGSGGISDSPVGGPPDLL